MSNILRPKFDQVASTIDHIGHMQTAAKELEVKITRSKRELTALLQANGDTRAQGNTYTAVLIDKDVLHVGWKAVAQKFAPSPQLLAAHTTRSHQTYPVVTLRKPGA